MTQVSLVLIVLIKSDITEQKPESGVKTVTRQCRQATVAAKTLMLSFIGHL